MPLRRVLLLAAALAAPVACLAQTADMPDWQKAAGGKMEFDAASVRQDTSGVFKPPSIALSTDDGSQPVDGLFHADFTMEVYLSFAYKVWMTSEQVHAMLDTLPKWVGTDNYEIQARAPGKPTKDQLRLMMQSLLAERFGLKAHFETQTVPVWALTLIKPGKLGPNLRPHTEAVPCPAPKPVGAAETAQVPANPPFPYTCGVYMMHPKAEKMMEAGSRDTTMTLVAGFLGTMGPLGRPVVDRTGLTGTYDFTVTFSPEATRAANAGRADPEAQGMAFMDAVHEQLGVKLESTKAPVPMLVIDHIERPSEN